jgi:NitT/TauT family transport system substrate-binding protein
MKRRTVLLALSAAAALPGRARAQSLPTVNALVLPLDAGAQLLYANDLGMFAKAGLNVNIQITGNGNTLVDAIVSGAADVSTTSIVTIEVAHRKGVPLTMIAPGAISDESYPQTVVVLVAKNSPIRTAKDLDGKTIGVQPIGGVGQYAIEAWMEKNGGDPAKSKYVEITFPQVAPALEAGRLDAAFMAEPFATQARATTRVLCQPMSAIAKRWLSSAYFTTTTWAGAHADVARKFAGVIAEAGDWGNKNQAKSAEILSKYSKVDLQTVLAMPRSRYPAAVTPAEVQPSIDFLAKYKLIDAGYPAREIIFG